MGRTIISSKVLNEFISTIKNMAAQRGYKFWRPQKRLQTYCLKTPNKTYMLFIKVSTIESGWWGIEEDLYQDAIKQLKKYNLAFVFLRTSKSGYMIFEKDFTRMFKEGNFYIGGKYLQIEIHEKYLPSRFEFCDFETFFEMLELPKRASSIKELPISQAVAYEALIRLLIEKGIFTDDEFLRMANQINQGRKRKKK